MTKKTDWDRVSRDIESGPSGFLKWCLMLAILLFVLFGAFNFIGKYLSVNADRIITKQSFQYKEGMAQRGAILEAQIAEIDIKLRSSDQETARLLLNQRDILTARLNAITINQ